MVTDHHVAVASDLIGESFRRTAHPRESERGAWAQQALIAVGENEAVTTLGVVFLPYFPPERLLSVARAADAAGLEELWLWEDCFYASGVASLSAALAATERLRVGMGLLPAPLRNVALTAMEVVTLARMFPGRLDVGVGHGVPEWMARVGWRAPSPLRYLRAYAGALRSLVRGEEVDRISDGVWLEHVSMEWPVAQVPPILVGAIGPRTLRLAGEVADGTILTGGTTPEGVRRARRLAEEGRAKARRNEPHKIVVYLHAAAGPDADAQLEVERRRWRYESMADVGVGGDARAVADGIRRWVEAGADTVVLQPPVDDPDPERFVRFVAEQVRPLVP